MAASPSASSPATRAARGSFSRHDTTVVQVPAGETSLTVRLTDKADNWVYADALRIEQVYLPTLEVTIGGDLFAATDLEGLTRPLPVGKEEDGDLMVNVMEISPEASFRLFFVIVVVSAKEFGRRTYQQLPKSSFIEQPIDSRKLMGIGNMPAIQRQ